MIPAPETPAGRTSVTQTHTADPSGRRLPATFYMAVLLPCTALPPTYAKNVHYSRAVERASLLRGWASAMCWYYGRRGCLRSRRPTRPIPVTNDTLEREE